MELITLADIGGNIGSLLGGIASISGVIISIREKNRLIQLENEFSKHVANGKIHHELSDDEYNLLYKILTNTMHNGTTERIKRFAKIAYDVFYFQHLDVSRGEKFVYAVNNLSDQEVAFLMKISVNVAELTDSKTHQVFINAPNSKGEWQTGVETAFTEIGITRSEWMVVLKKLDYLGILQYEETYVVGGLKYALSVFGQEFIRYLLTQDDMDT